MLSTCKTLLRWSFALTAMFLLPATVSVLMQRMVVIQRIHAQVPLSFYGRFAVALAAGLIFSVACWATRKPGIYRSWWAIAASLLQIAGGYYFLQSTSRLGIASPQLMLLVAGIAGLLVFSRSETVSTPVAAAAAMRTHVPGDRTSAWFDRVSTIIITIAAWVVVGGWFPWARAHNLHVDAGLPLLLLIALVTLLNAVFHECGHALVAHAFQMKLLGFNAGPFQWRKREGTWRFQFKSSGILGGAVHVVPTNPDQPGWQDVCMVAAGPLTNICLSPVFLWAALHAQGTRFEAVWFFFALMASFSLLVAAFNLLPMQSGTGSYSDGARILQLLTNSPVVELQRTTRRLQSTAVTPAVLQGSRRRHSAATAETLTPKPQQSTLPR
jgi:Zn-dependent protease